MGEAPQYNTSLVEGPLDRRIGAELVRLCAAITADGAISKDELIGLHRWLCAHRGSGVPAVSALAGLMDRIVADKQVTAEELAELQTAIERVLSREAVANGAPIDRWAQARKGGGERETKQQERERNAVMDSASFPLTGATADGRAETINRAVAPGSTVFLIRDRKNAHHKDAVQVRTIDGTPIGYVPHAAAKTLAPLLNQGCRHTAYVTRIEGSPRKPIPVVQAHLYRPDATVEGAVSEAQVPPENTPKLRMGAGKSGCAILILLIMLLSALLAVCACW